MDWAEEALKYPIGRFEAPPEIRDGQLHQWIQELSQLPGNLRHTVRGLEDGPLDTPYRTGGWSVRQVVHHVADSHLNSYIRFRWALTEETPLIKVYEQDAWAELPDARSGPVGVSLDLLEALHTRWVTLLKSLQNSDFARTLRHPQLGELKLAWMLGLYAWHGRHHVAQIQALRAARGW